jgi:ATP/ADP translocase
MMLTPSAGGSSRTTAAAVVTALSAVKNSSIVSLPPNWSNVVATPKSKSAIAMASAMAIHFFGYEFARGSNMALFTSETLGFGSASGSYYPLAMTLVSPVSMALLLIYGRQLDTKGPRRALRNTTILCISMLALSGVAVAVMQYNARWASIKCLSWTLSQLVVWISFIFQNSYAQLMYAQQWSFLGSIFTPTEAGKYYSYIAGMSSISSMIAGGSVSMVVNRIGLTGLLGIAATSLSCTCLLADWAYSLSEKYGFGPEIERQRSIISKKNVVTTQSLPSDMNKHQQQHTQTNNSLLDIARNGISLIRRVPTLGALFLEAFTFESLATILSMSLVTQLKDAVPNDDNRAAWTGTFYSTVNGLSMVFQFLIMPTLSKHTEPRALWRLMPILPLLCALVQYLPKTLFPQQSSSTLALYLVAISFLTAKTLGYSLRGILAEMAYMPLSFDARFRGKEIVAVFANRMGKSGMAMLLSGLQFSSGGRLGLSGLTLFATLGWLSSVVCLSNLIPSKAEAELLVAQRNMAGDNNEDTKKEQ